MTDADLIRALTDRQAISDQIYRYCRAVDRLDHALGYAVWHEDGTADYGASVFQGTGRGFIDYVCAAHAQLLVHSHQVTNIIIELDSDRAGSESYVTANLQMQAGDGIRHMEVWSRYIDRWSRRYGRWAIDNRTTIIDLDEVRMATPMNQGTRGSRDREDASYGVLRTR